MVFFWVSLAIYLTAIIAHALTREFAPPVIVHQINHVVERTLIAPGEILQVQHECLVSEDLIQHYGLEQILSREKRGMMDQLVKKAEESGFVEFVEIPEDWRPRYPPERHFRVRMFLVNPKHLDGLSERRFGTTFNR